MTSTHTAPGRLYNSLFRTVCIYGISLVVTGITGLGSFWPSTAWKIDMFNDMLALMIYVRTLPHILNYINPPSANRGLTVDIVEALMLITLTQLFSLGHLDLRVILLALLCVLIYHYVLRQALNRWLTDAGYEHSEEMEDMILTLMLLSATDTTWTHNRWAGMLSKIVALLIYHRFVKIQ